MLFEVQVDSKWLGFVLDLVTCLSLKIFFDQCVKMSVLPRRIKICNHILTFWPFYGQKVAKVKFGGHFEYLFLAGTCRNKLYETAGIFGFSIIVLKYKIPWFHAFIIILHSWAYMFHIPGISSSILNILLKINMCARVCLPFSMF